MKQAILQLYPAISIIIMLLIRLKLSAKQEKNLKKSSGSKHGVQHFG